MEESPPPRPSSPFAERRSARAIIVCLLIMLASPAVGQTVRRVSITGDRLSGFVLPIEPLEGNVTISAMRAWTWDVDDTKRLLLESDVEIRVGDHRFIANEAVVWMNRLPSAEGLINQFAFFFDKVSDPTGPAGVGMEGEQLLVTASSRGSVSLRVSALEQEAPRLSSVLRRGELRLAEHLKRLVADPPGLARHPQGDRAVEIEAFRPEVGGSVNESDLVLPAEIELPAVDDTLPPLITPRSVIGFTAGQVDLIPGEAENVILLRGGMVVQYGTDDRNEEFSALTLSAQRGVIFTRPGSVQELAGSSLESEDIYGVYLEGNVLIAADDGDYAARAPYVYYDFRTGQAAMFNAVLRTYARDTSIPVYARARELRQVAANQWVGKHMRVSTSEFFTPHIALGAETATITRRPAKADPLRRETYVVSENNTIRASDTPFLWWPTFAGTVRDIPLPQISIGGRENDGVQLETRWDLFQLLGIAKPAGTDTKLLVDAFTERGAAVGLDFKFDVAEGYGVVDLYFMYDEGTDKTSTGIEVEPDGTERGVALADHRLDLGQDWDIQTQIAWISDPTFITSRRENDFYTRREYETSLLLRNQVEGGSFTFLTQYSLNDFTSNSWLLASKAYSVDRVSEAVYQRYGDEWFDALTYSGHIGVSRMQIRPDESTPAELGIRGVGVGVPDDVPISARFAAQGYPLGYVPRFDTRHELALPTEAGPVQITPFVAGRFTAWGDDVEQFSSDTESKRLFGSAGVRVGTEVQHVDNDVSSRLLGLNRMRHIVEPSMTVWYGYSDVDDGAYPVYDERVEALSTGTSTRFGVRNTWQTQRGGPGQWRSVDWITFDANVTFAWDETARSPSPQFFDYRPEYSQLGDFADGSLVWLLSDAVSVIGSTIWDLDNSTVARGSLGAQVAHSPRFSTYVEYRFLDASDLQLLGIGWDYEMTKVYRLGLTPQWDFQFNEFRAVGISVTRSFPDFDLRVSVTRDEIADDTRFSASMDVVEF